MQNSRRHGIGSLEPRPNRIALQVACASEYRELLRDCIRNHGSVTRLFVVGDLAVGSPSTELGAALCQVRSTGTMFVTGTHTWGFTSPRWGASGRGIEPSSAGDRGLSPWARCCLCLASQTTGRLCKHPSFTCCSHITWGRKCHNA